MKKFTKSIFFILLVSIFLGASLFVGCRNPFMPEGPNNPSNGGGNGDKPNDDVGGGTGGENQNPEDLAKEPKITSQPQSLTVGTGVEFTLTVVAESLDGGTLSYKWYKSNAKDAGAEIAGATSASLTTSYTIEDESDEVVLYYYVVVTNSTKTKTASVKSEYAEVTVNKKENANVPKITVQPVGYTGTESNPITLTIQAESLDNGTLTYQWYKKENDVESKIDGATSASYDIGEPTENGCLYWCEVTNTIQDNGDGGVKSQSIKSEIVFVMLSKGIGFTHPVSGDLSPVDLNGETDGYGWVSLEDKPGVTLNGDGSATFTVYSANATKMLLEIYNEKWGRDAITDYWMEKGSDDDYWRAKVEGIEEGTLYAFRAWGPNWPYDEDWTRGGSSEGFISDVDSNGNRFNPNKVLFDPYAKEISHDKSNPEVLAMVTNAETPSAIYASGERNLINGKPSREFDTGRFNSKAVVIDNSLYTGLKPNIPQEKAIIYEAHVKGITAHPSTAKLSSILAGIDGFEDVVDITGDAQGTYKGAGMLAPYLKALGINTIELLPVHESDNENTPEDKSGGNYWSYMTYGYFAPERRYSSDKSYGGPTREFKEMIDAFHDAGIEVYLDVVYNHSGEGGPWYGGPTKWEPPASGVGDWVEVTNQAFDNYGTIELTFMRGLDNSTYYSLTKADKRAMQDDTGCGNNLQCDNPVVRQLILDSLSYWVDYMGVDGYRFDLAPVLGREYDDNAGYWAYNPNAETLQQIAALGITKNVDMVAEAWDINTYGVGTFPYGWAEWNGRYRDPIRGYVGKGERGSFLDYMNGDYNYFNDNGGPHKSINFVVAHDGFTLADLCSYQGNGNALNSSLGWPFGPSDGGNGDWNQLDFGSTAADKRRANRNYIAIQMMSRGVPMIVWGDELSRTQKGNNNAYNVDSVGTWSNYNMISTASPHAISTEDPYGGLPYDNNFGTFNNNGVDSSDTDGVNGNFMFMKYMLNLKANEPALNLTDYSVGYDFKKEDGTTDLTDGDRCVWVRINGSGVTGTDAEGNTVQGGDYLVFMNMYTSAVSFSVPTSNGEIWKLLVDTSSAKETNFNYYEVTDETQAYSNASYSVPAWSVVILKNYGKGTTSTPVISYEADADNYKMTVSIDCATEGAEIYYTTDGTTPSKSSTLYTESFELDVSAKKTVKAIAYKADYNDSSVASKDLHIQKYTIYCKPKSGWTGVNLHIWKTDGSSLTTWPGAAMTSDGDGWYSYEVIDINEGYDSILFNDGIDAEATKTADITMDPTKRYYVMDALGWASSKQATDVAPVIPSKIAISDGKGWGQIYAYFFANNQPVGTSWPGTAMTKESTNEYGQGVFVINVPDGATHVIFNNGSGTQTVDIKLDSTTGYWVNSAGSDGKYTVGTWSYK